MKILFVALNACLNDRLEPKGDRFELAKVRIAEAFSRGWRVYLFRDSDWGQNPSWPNRETDRYELPDNRWGRPPQPIYRWGVAFPRDLNYVVNQLADAMDLLQPANKPVMRLLFCPNLRADLPTSMIEIKFNYRQAMNYTVTSFNPGWIQLANDGPGNESFALPSAGMMKTVLLFQERYDHRAALVWHEEPDRVAAQSIEVPLYSSQEWLSGIDPIERSKFFKNKSVSIWSWEKPYRDLTDRNDWHWQTNNRPSLLGD